MGATLLKETNPRTFGMDRIVLLRGSAILALWAIWEAAARSGWFYDGVVTSSVLIANAMVDLLSGKEEFYRHLAVSSAEVLSALAIGGVTGVVIGICVGGNRFLRDLLEPVLYYLAPTPKIVLLPILIALFGVGMGSKMAVGALSAFFPVAMSTAAGMHEINPIHLQVGKSFNLTLRQTVAKIYLPSLTLPILSGLRLGLGLAIVGTLLSETKLSNQGLGFLAIQYYNLFRIPELYAVLVFTFGLAGTANAVFAVFEARTRTFRNV